MAVSLILHSWLLLVPLIPSVIVAIFSLYHLLSSQALRTALNNHVIILLLCVGLISSVTDYVWTGYFYRTGIALSSTPAFCLAWVFVSASGLVIAYLLMAWASIERHILIFYSTWFATARKRFFFHYLPLIICIVWPLIFCCVTLLILPCNIPFSYSNKQCARYSCIFAIGWIALMDSIFHYILPTFIVVIFSVVLLVRVIYQKYQIHQRVEWRNYKRMAFQLLPISALYFCISFPTMILYAAYSAGVPRTVAADYFLNSIFLCFWIILFTLFAIVPSLPQWRTKCTKLFLFWRAKRRVNPEIPLPTRLKAGRTNTATFTHQ
ncbi:unnamed protein product [Adineta steineri]|uniref:G-protein coupled receptors family 1 profile domain-containing protein n=1 Tax=Adineta steineri TaxID=433720 RepID=A0A814DH48_9BILA|nr:unnamed protein product [Adineta steineri]